jgi:hypothetical protein
MRKATAIACVFVDVGAVRQAYEEGKLTLEEYLGQVVFYQWRTQRVSDSQIQAGQSVGTVANWSASVIVVLPFPTPRKILGKSATFWWYKAVIHASC